MSNENNTQDVKIAEMAVDIAHIKGFISKVDARLEIMGNHFASKESVQDLKDDKQAAHKDFEYRLRNIEKDMAIFFTQVKTWGAVGMVTIGVIQFLVGKFL